METKTDESFGVVPVIKNESGDWEIFLINQINRFGGTFWGFPKGHSEPGENNEMAARRELKEETNIELHNLEVAHPFNQAYTFMDNEVLISKSVTYYLGYALNKDYVLQTKEVAEARWCDLKTARELLTHNNNRELLSEVEQFLINKM